MKNIQIVILIIISLTFFSCKKEIESVANSNTSINFFTGNYNDKVNAVEITNDGGFIYCGYTNNGINNTDAFLLKVNALGKQEWYQKYGGKNYDAFQHVINTSEGNFVAVGCTNSHNDSNYVLNPYTIKTNASGNIKWSSIVSNLISKLNYVTEISPNTYLTTGGTNDRSFYLVNLKIKEKNDTSREISGLFYNFKNISPFLVNRDYLKIPTCLTKLSNNESMVSGVMSFSDNPSEVRKMVTFIMKISNDSLYPVWLQPYYDLSREGSSFNGIYYSPQTKYSVVKVIPLNDGYLLGTFTENALGILQLQIIKTTLDGFKIWSKVYSGLGNAYLTNMVENKDGSILLIGASSKEPVNINFPDGFLNLKCMLLKIDKDGNEIWTNYFGSENNVNIPYHVQQQNDGGWLVACKNANLETGFDKMYVVKIDKNGKLK